MTTSYAPQIVYQHHLHFFFTDLFSLIPHNNPSILLASIGLSQAHRPSAEQHKHCLI